MEMFLSVADASKILGVTPQTVRLMVRRGTLVVAAKTVGGIQLFRADQIEGLADARRERARHVEIALVVSAADGPDGKRGVPEDDHGGHP